MIKVGDKFTGIYGRKEVVTSIWLNDKTVGVESGLAYSYEEVYKSWYQQQKQRADELEKRWSEMEERMEREQKEAFSKGYIDYDTFSYVLEVMQDLQEDNNA